MELKPQVGAGSSNIQVVERQQAPLTLFNLDPFRGWLVQPFLKEILAGDFRVQEEHGGTILPY